MRHLEAGVGDIDRPAPELGWRCMRPQRAHEGGEISPGAGAEFPVVVHRQHHLSRHRCQRPCRCERCRSDEIGVLDRNPETRLAAELESGHHARHVIRVRDQHARAYQSRQLEVGRSIQRRAHIRFGAVRAGGLRMHPGPAVLEVGQLVPWFGRRRELQGGQRRIDRAAERHAVLFAYHHQAEPWAQLRVGVGTGGCEQPWEIGAIELDARKIGGLEIGAAGTRIGAHDLIAIDADDVGWTAQAHRHRQRGRRVDRESCIQVDDAGLLGSQRVDRRDGRCHALTHPRQESQAGSRTGIGSSSHEVLVIGSSSGGKFGRRHQLPLAPARLRELSTARCSLQVRTLGATGAGAPPSRGTMSQLGLARLTAAAAPSTRKRARPTRRTGARAAAPVRLCSASCAGGST